MLSFVGKGNLHHARAFLCFLGGAGDKENSFQCSCFIWLQNFLTLLSYLYYCCWYYDSHFLLGCGRLALFTGDNLGRAACVAMTVMNVVGAEKRSLAGCCQSLWRTCEILHQQLVLEQLWMHGEKPDSLETAIHHLTLSHRSPFTGGINKAARCFSHLLSLALSLSFPINLGPSKPLQNEHSTHPITTQGWKKRSKVTATNKRNWVFAMELQKITS